MNIYKPFTYLIGWSNYNVWYYGVRYAKNCSTNDLWTIYFTSSKHVRAFRHLHGEPDVIQIRKVFESKHLAIEHEQKLIRRAKLHLNDNFLNKGAQKAFNVSTELLSKKMIALNKSTEARLRSKERMLRSNPMRDPLIAEKSAATKRGRPNPIICGDNHPLRKHEELRKQKSESMIGRVWCNDGVRNKFVRAVPPGFVRGRIT